jgi:mannose/fructose-specific phosphotransferase system component IIA
VAARLSADYPMAVISGLNASLLLEALDKREQGPLTGCVSELVEAGRSSCLRRCRPRSAVTTINKEKFMAKSFYVASIAV